MTNAFHRDILKVIRDLSGKPENDSFLNSYLGNDHVRYRIDMPTLRIIAKDWMRSHHDVPADVFTDMITSFVEGKSSTEKIMAGIMLGYSRGEQRKFDPMIFDQWLDHLIGWAEIDALCTGDFTTRQLPADWPRWKKLLKNLVKDPNINKRRASLVLFCSPVSKVKDDRLAEVAFQHIDQLRSEKEVLITKAISWVLRSMIKHHRENVSEYLDDNKQFLPRIAVRETLRKLETGKKTNVGN